MSPDSSILDQLSLFRQRDLFSDSAWRARGLNPSGYELSRGLTDFFHGISQQLTDAVAAERGPRACRRILQRALERLNKGHYDTEEREFIAELFGELGAIVGVDMRFILNRWLYGPVLTALLALARWLRPDRVLAVLAQPCLSCAAQLETQILGKRADIPDTGWLIIRCSNCHELNLLSLGAGIARVRYGNYELVEQLSKAEYSEEQARIRLEQIKYFRK